MLGELKINFKSFSLTHYNGSCFGNIFVRATLNTSSNKYFFYILNNSVTDRYPIMLNINK